MKTQKHILLLETGHDGVSETFFVRRESGTILCRVKAIIYASAQRNYI